MIRSGVKWPDLTEKERVELLEYLVTTVRMFGGHLSAAYLVAATVAEGLERTAGEWPVASAPCTSRARRRTVMRSPSSRECDD